MNPVSIVQTRSLGLRAGTRTLIAGLDLAIEPGQLWCLLGPNGSGKTSLLHALAGLRAPDAGTITLQQRPLSQWTAADAAHVRGLFPQAVHDAFSASALDVTLMGRYPHLQGFAWESDADRQLALDALRAVEMKELAGRDVTTLSGGERARVGIATLLAQDPQLMLLDEPLAHLDLHHQIVVLQHLSGLVRERAKAVMLALHDLNLASRFATHVLLLGPAGQAYHGSADTVLTQARLSAAFGHAVVELRAGARQVFVAG
jgi:iron complex transport system ATP-binding protein